MSLPEMFHVQSSNVESIGYDQKSETVYVKFLDGKVYAYKGVHQNEYDNLMNATSVGSHLHRNFKNVYPYERVE